MAKPRQKFEARKLRKDGESIKVIAKMVGVSQGTVSLWCRDVKLSREQIRELERRAKDPLYGRRLAYALKQQKERTEKIKRLHKKGASDIGNLNKRELFLVGVALYWAEGFKKDSQAGLASSDPKMIKLYIKWLEECCNVDRNRLSIRVTVNISHRHRTGEIEDYWSKVVGINKNQFQKIYLQKVKWKKQYDNPNEYFGVLRVKARKSIDLLRLIYGWIDGLRLQVD